MARNPPPRHGPLGCVSSAPPQPIAAERGANAALAATCLSVGLREAAAYAGPRLQLALAPDGPWLHLNLPAPSARDPHRSLHTPDAQCPVTRRAGPPIRMALLSPTRIGGLGPRVAEPGAARATVSGVVRAERRCGGGGAGVAGRGVRRTEAAGVWRERWRRAMRVPRRGRG